MTPPPRASRRLTPPALRSGPGSRAKRPAQHRVSGAAAVAVALTLALALPAGFLVRPVPGASAPRTPAASTPAASIRAAAATAPPERWRSPLPGPLRLWRGFEPPEHPYGPGHRGIDLAPVAAGAAVVAPTDGSLFFAGTVVDRGVLTIRVDERTLLSVEPLGPAEPPPDPAAESDGEPVPRPGEAVRRGSVIGELGGVSHCAPAHCLHLGVRVDGEYVNPLPYFLGRPVLLPLE